MAQYYGITRTDEYLAHYGVKGMKWGVRKAIEKGDSKALKRHYEKALNKLNKLYNKANLVNQRIDRRSYGKLAALSAAQAGISAASVKGLGIIERKSSPGYKYYAGLLPLEHVKTMMTVAGGANGLLGAYGAGQALASHHRMSSKGHAKAVKNINEWSNAMQDAFKGTKYEKRNNKKYKDVYKLVDYKQINSKGKPKTVASIQGSHLTRNYKGKDKKTFLEAFKNQDLDIKSPRTNSHDPFDGWETNYQEYSGNRERSAPQTVHAITPTIPTSSKKKRKR